MAIKNPEEEVFGKLFEKRLLLRLKTWSCYSFGGLDEHYKRSLNSGEQAWRILRYERITDPENHLYPISVNRYVRPKTFEKHAKYLSEECKVVPLEHLLRLIESGSPIEPKTVAITFDNGWVDNYQHALPILVKHNLPATIFLVTGFIGTDDLLWPDKLMLAMLTLSHHSFNFREASFFAEYMPELPADGKLEMLEASRQTAQLISLLRSLPREERLSFVVAVFQQTEQFGGFPIERGFLSWDEVKEMEKLRLTFGIQGDSRFLFSETDADLLEADIVQALTTMRENEVKIVPAFAYPDGEMSDDGRRMLKRLGVRHSLTIGSSPTAKAPAPDDKEVLVHGRVPLYESVSFCKDFLACRLWAAGKISELKY
jgi:peptidoglycan/xylan/chitin deacetylase (PgdA/CDA1 family)